MLTDPEIERYARHLLLREIGGQGQQAFQRARVAVLGAGGLGSPALAYLAAAGVGAITIIDGDAVELSNLQRQILFATGDIGKTKATVVAARLADLNPHVKIAARSVRLDADNVLDLVCNHDVIVDGCDNFLTRTILNSAAVRLQIPLVSGALGSFEGQLGVFAGHLGTQPCWACYAGQPADIPGDSCAEAGVVGAVAGIVGAAMALEALRLVHPFGAPRIGTLWLYDALGPGTRLIRVRKDPSCPVCGN
jgi:adenylyltransferase/sulfurtransferase